MYMYIYTHMYIYTYKYIYIYVSNHLKPPQTTWGSLISFKQCISLTKGHKALVIVVQGFLGVHDD